MREDIKYPYIGELRQDGILTSVALFASHDFGALLKRTSDEFELHEFEGDYNESEFTNITCKYLANTYGKVESKEHAEFIVELAEVGDLDVYTDGNKEIERNYFTFNKHGVLFFYVCSDERWHIDRKQITIPMPPKEVEAVDEWPRVNDEVVLVSMGMTTYDKPVRLTYIGDGVGCYVDLTNGMEYTYAKRETVFKKPKTPEEDLRDEFARDLDSIYLSSDAISASPSCDDDFEAYASEMIKLGWIKSNK